MDNGGLFPIVSPIRGAEQEVRSERSEGITFFGKSVGGGGFAIRGRPLAGLLITKTAAKSFACFFHPVADVEHEDIATATE